MVIGGAEKLEDLEAVDQKPGVRRERIQQIEGKALRQLRQPRLAQRLSEYTS